MHFSWKGFWVAPLVMPVIGCAVMAPVLGNPGLAVIATFLLLLVAACIISYGAMLFLFLPMLFVLSRLTDVTRWMVWLLGLVLGAVVFLPVAKLAWATGGPNSGPMDEEFWHFFAGWLTEPFMLFYPLGGLVTAGLYWWFGTRRQRVPELETIKG
jgi:hypothetical protein